MYFKHYSDLWLFGIMALLYRFSAVYCKPRLSELGLQLILGKKTDFILTRSPSTSLPLQHEVQINCTSLLALIFKGLVCELDVCRRSTSVFWSIKKPLFEQKPRTCNYVCQYVSHLSPKMGALELMNQPVQLADDHLADCVGNWVCSKFMNWWSYCS